jgi:transposase
MANKLDPMDIKQIIRLHIDGYSNREIAETLGIGRNTVNRKIRELADYGVDMATLLTYDSKALTELFPSVRRISSDRLERLAAFFHTMIKSIDATGFTFQFHYFQYAEQEADPYSYTQFMEHYHRIYTEKEGSMKLNHEAGRELFVDYTGKRLSMTDASTGKQIQLEVFVAILPFSQYTYVEASRSQKTRDVLASITRAHRFFGGSTKAIVSDNLKSAVTRSSKYEPIINRSLKELASHYGCVVNPTRTYSPQDKALVESAVNLVYQRIFHPMREMTFFSIDEVNRQIRVLLKDYNSMMFSRRDISRHTLFVTAERPFLKPLPAGDFEIADYTRAKVQKIGYVYFSVDRSYYSVPYRYIGEATQIRYTHSSIEVYCNSERIAIHQRDTTSGKYITIDDHLCSKHRAYKDWSPEFFENRARQYGQYTEAWVRGVFAECDYPEVNYKRVMGVLQLGTQYGPTRLECACEIAVIAGIYSYHRVSNILKNGTDKIFSEHHALKPSLPLHGNIRGASYYS